MSYKKFVILSLALIAPLSSMPCVAQSSVGEVQQYTFENIPIIWIEPDDMQTRRPLVVWQDQFTGYKERTIPLLKELASMGYIAVSYDNFQHGKRRIPGDRIWKRVFSPNKFRKEMWPIIGQSVEDASKVIDWAQKNLNTSGDICMGGLSMGGDISVAAASNDKRIKCVAAVISTPNWKRPSMYDYYNNKILVLQGEADSKAQSFYDKYNPSTNIEKYAHKPAITFESGEHDKHVPASDANAFCEQLLTRFPGISINVTIHSAGHSLSDGMWENSKAWFKQHLN